MSYAKGDLVEHPTLDWGRGLILRDSDGRVVYAHFEKVGAKTLDLRYVALVSVGDDAVAGSNVESDKNKLSIMSQSYTGDRFVDIYTDLKSKLPDHLVLIQSGFFYEILEDDAEYCREKFDWVAYTRGGAELAVGFPINGLGVFEELRQAEKPFVVVSQVATTKTGDIERQVSEIFNGQDSLSTDAEMRVSKEDLQRVAPTTTTEKAHESYVSRSAPSLENESISMVEDSGTTVRGSFAIDERLASSFEYDSSPYKAQSRATILGNFPSTNLLGLHPLTDRICHRSGYIEGDISFDIGGLEKRTLSLPPFVRATYCAITRGAPSVPSPFLESALNFCWDDSDKTPLYLNSAKPLVWDHIIKGRNETQNPARQFFNHELYEDLGEFGFVRELMVPEYPLFDLVADQEQLLKLENQSSVDFYLPQLSLVIEIDGEQHKRSEALAIDRTRDHILKANGVTTFRLQTSDLQLRGSSYQQKLAALRALIGQSDLCDRFDPGRLQQQYEERELSLALTAVHRLQVTVLELLRTGQLSLGEAIWRVDIKSDWEFSVHTNWVEVAFAELFHWFEIFAPIYGCAFSPPVIAQESGGLEIHCSLLSRASEIELASGAITINTSAVQALPVKGGRTNPLFPKQLEFWDVDLDEVENTRVGTLAPLNQMIFGHESFRDGQLEIIDNVLSGSNSIGLLPTGGGKSLTFQLPTLLNTGVTIAVVPIRALGRDHCMELEASGFGGRVINLDAEIKGDDRERVLHDIIQGRYRFVFVAPERLQTDAFIGVLKQLALNGLLNYLVVDEAHCFSEWGHDFRPAYLMLPFLFGTLANHVPVVALTATAAVNTLRDLQSEFDVDDEFVTYGMKQGRPELTFKVRATDGATNATLNNFGELRTQFSTSARQPAALLFSSKVNGMDGAFNHFNELRANFPKLKVGLFTGAQPKGWTSRDGAGGFAEKPGLDWSWETYKQEVQKRWKANELDVVVATKAFGMGVNKPNVRFGVHAQMPSSQEAFYQEAGRTGRDGKPATCLLLYKREPDQVKAKTAELLRDPNPAAVTSFISSVNSRATGNLRSQFWFANQTNFDIGAGVRLMARLHAGLPTAGGACVIDRSLLRDYVDSGHDFQVALFRLHQLGIIDYWLVSDWGIGAGGVRIVRVVAKAQPLDEAISALKKKILTHTGLNLTIEASTFIEALEAIDCDDSSSAGWASLYEIHLQWVQQSQVKARFASVRNLYMRCYGFEPTPQGESRFKEHIENHFTINNDTFRLSDLRDKRIEEAAESLEVILSNRDGKLKSARSLRRLEAQVERLREGTVDNRSLNFAAGVLLMLLSENDSSELLTLFGDSNKPDSESVLTGECRDFVAKLAHDSDDFCKRLESYLVSGEGFLNGLMWFHSEFGGENSKAAIFSRFAGALRQEI